MRTHCCHTSPAIRRYGRGFTLIELVITTLLLAILGAVGAGLLYEPFSTAKIVNATNMDAAKARYALERVARELREVKMVGSAYCFTSSLATTNSISFRNMNSSSTNDCTTGGSVTIALSGTDLQIGGETLANNVAAFSLTYKDISDVTTTSASSVVSVVISLTVTDPDSGQPNSLRTRVFLRNAPP